MYVNSSISTRANPKFPGIERADRALLDVKELRDMRDSAFGDMAAILTSSGVRKPRSVELTYIFTLDYINQLIGIERTI
jgi:hypothetical protein